jgi:hypothetical protein
MNSHEDDRTRAARTQLPAHSGATRDRAVAALSRAQTSDALHDPWAVIRDRELVRIHAEAGRFYQACLKGSWVPGYLADRGLAAALLPTSPWKIGYAPFSLLCCRVSLTVLSRAARAFVNLHLMDNSSYLPRSWS